MFFFLVIILIAQLLVMGICISHLLSLDVKILILADALETYNSWLASRSNSIEGIFSDVKNLIKKHETKIEKRHKKFIVGQVIGLLEWSLLFFIKNKGKKFLLGYKIAKALYDELSMLKNMV